MKNLKTVEEKQYQINRPKYYGWYSHILSQVEIQYLLDKMHMIFFAGLGPPYRP